MANTSLDLTGWDLMQAQRSASKLTHLPYGSRLTPVHHNLERLFEQEFIAIPRLLACDCPQGLKDAAVKDYPEWLDARKRDLSSAILYEMSRYGCVLLEKNPYEGKRA